MKNKCVYTYSVIDFDTIYDSGCSEYYFLHSDSDVLYFKYCPYCGKEIEFKDGD